MSIDAAVVIDITRLQKVFLQLQSTGEHASDLTRSVAASLLSSSEMAFELQKDPEGEPWEDWSEAWRDWRTKHGYVPGRILTLNGDLARRLTTEYGDTYALIGSNEPYAAIHQWGGKPGMAPGPAAIGARPYMGLDRTGEQEILALVKKRLERALTAS